MPRKVCDTVDALQEECRFHNNIEALEAALKKLARCGYARMLASRRWRRRCASVLGNMAAWNKGAIFNTLEPINHEPLRLSDARKHRTSRPRTGAGTNERQLENVWHRDSA